MTHSTNRRPKCELLPFPEATYKDRLKLVQADLRVKNLAGGLLFSPENMFWLTGYQTIGYFAFHTMFVPLEGMPVVVAWVVNRNLALAYPTIGSFVTILDTQDPVQVLTEFLHNQVRHEGVIGVESRAWFLTVAHYQRLTETLSRRLTSWNCVIEPYRMIKTEDELKYIRQACRAAEAGLDAAVAVIQPGKTENDVASAMLAASITAGSEYLGHPPLIVTGRMTSLCFAMWRRREIRDGDVVLLESAGCINRYHGMVARPVVVGRSSQRHRDAADALRSALDAAIATVRHGVRAGEVDRACRSVLEDKHFGPYFWQEVGYSIGIGFPPTWSESYFCSIQPGSKLILETNMTFHLIPTLFVEDFGMCLSDSICVTENGCEVLTSYSRELKVI